MNVNKSLQTIADTFLKELNIKDSSIEIYQLFDTHRQYGICFSKKFNIDYKVTAEYNLINEFRKLIDELKNSSLTCEFRQSIKEKDAKINELKEQIHLLQTKLEFDEEVMYPEEEE